VLTTSSQPAFATAQATPGAGLELRGIACERGGRRLFGKLDCKIGHGQLLRVTGVNGSGKTSLLRMVCGLLAPAEGSVLWRQRPITSYGEDYGRNMVYMGHAAALKDDLSALENLQIACLLGGIRITANQALGALRLAGLGGRERLAARLLSQGQRRRVALARLVLASATPLWILDEPFNALDAAATEWLCGLISAHLAEQGVVVLTSHQSVRLDNTGGQVRVEL